MINVKISIDSDLIQLNKNVCISTVKSVLSYNKINTGDITIIFGKDNLLSRLKKQYFGLDQLTDVIAFRYNEESDEELEGEIYISLQRAKDNANDFNEPLKKEIARLIIHGSLHLIGFDDDTEKSKNEMINWEEMFLKKIDWNHIINN